MLFNTLRDFLTTFRAHSSFVNIEPKAITKGFLDLNILVIVMVWLHLQDEVSTTSVSIGGVEYACVLLEPAGGLVPLATVEVIKVITPVELELIMFWVVCEDLNIVV